MALYNLYNKNIIKTYVNGGTQHKLDEQVEH